MAGSPTLVDWKTALASGVKIGVLLESLNNTKQPEAGKESPTTDINLPPDQFGQTSNPKDGEASENMKLVGLTEEPLEFRWAEPSLRHIDLKGGQ